MITKMIYFFNLLHCQTKQGVPCDDSDSDLEDFHYILDQSELQLKLVDQSLRKKRKDPMGTGLHPNPAKYVGPCVSSLEF